MPAPQAVGLVPDAGGLQPQDTALRIDFGREQAGVVAAVSRLLRQPPEQQKMLPGCGEAVVWPNGLWLIFIDRDFRGWALGGAAAGARC
jgi:hypothetical protein